MARIRDLMGLLRAAREAEARGVMLCNWPECTKEAEIGIYCAEHDRAVGDGEVDSLLEFMQRRL